jgi:hypothetical protein
MECLSAAMLVNGEGSHAMEGLPFEPVELTEFELDAVAGGNPFSINITALLSSITATVNSTLANNSSNAQLNTLDNSIHITGP